MSWMVFYSHFHGSICLTRFHFFQLVSRKTRQAHLQSRPCIGVDPDSPDALDAAWWPDFTLRMGVFSIFNSQRVDLVDLSWKIGHPKIAIEKLPMRI